MRKPTDRHAQQLIQTRAAGALAAMDISSGNLLATIDATGDVRVWDIARRALVGSARHPALHGASAIAWAPDGRSFAVLTRRNDEYVRITWLDARAHTTSAPSCAPENMLPLGRRGALHWIARGSGGITLLDASCKRVALQLPPSVDATASLQISADGSTLAAKIGKGWGLARSGIGTPSNESLVVWPFGAPERSRTVPIKPHRGEGSFLLGPQGTFAVVARGVGAGAEDEENPHRLAFVPLDGHGDTRSFGQLPSYVGSLDISPDGTLVAGVSTDNAEGMFAVSSIRERRTLWERHTQALDGNVPIGAEFSPSGGWLVVPTEGPIYVFDAETGRLYARLGAIMPATPTQVAFVRPDVLATTSADRVTLWSLRDGRVIERERVRAAIAVGTTPTGDLAIARSPNHWTDPTFGHEGRRDTRWQRNAAEQAHWDQECPYEHHNGPAYGQPYNEIWPLYLEAWKGLEPRERGVDPLETTGVAKVVKPAWPPARLSRRCFSGYAVDAVDLEAGIAIVLGENMSHHLLDLATGKDVALQNEPGYLRLRFSADGSRVVNYDKEWIDQHDVPAAYVWDAHTGALLKFWRATAAGIGDASAVGTYALARDGHTMALVVSGRTGHALVIRDLDAEQTLKELPLDVPPTSLAFGATAHDLYLGTPEGELVLLRDGVEVARGASNGGSIDSITFEASSVATVSSDGAVRIWDPARAVERVALVAFDDDESLAFTPHGAYVGTHEASDRVVWVFDDPVEPFRFSQFAESFERPDAVARRLAGDDVDVTAADERPPLAPEILETRVEGDTAHVRTRVQAGSRVRALHAFVDGRPVESKLVCAADAEVAIDVPLGSGVSSIALAADDDRGRTSNPSTTRVQGPAAAGRPDLWIVSIGVDHYPNLPARFQLGFAAADARGIADGFAAQAGPNGTYANVHRRVLTDSEASVDSVRIALAELEQMRPQDVAVVFFGGHGIKPDGKDEMVFVTGAVKGHVDGSVDAASLVDAGIGWTQIGDLLARARGRVLVLLDACHSGVVAGDVVQNGDLAASLMQDRRAGAIVFAAAKGRQFSYEPTGVRGFTITTDAQALVMPAQESSHGYFTGAVLQSLASQDTDADRDGVIELSEVVDDVARRVSAATVGHQTPWVARREIFGDFGIAAPTKATTTTPPQTPNWDEEPDGSGYENGYSRALKQLEEYKAAKEAQDKKTKKDKKPAKRTKQPVCEPGDPLCVP